MWDKQLEQMRPFKFGDAAILYRATTNLPLVEDRFKAAGLPYIAISGRGYFDRPEVQDLISLLSVLHNPADDMSIAAILRSPLFCLSDETLFRLRRRTDQNEPANSPTPFLQALHSPPPTNQMNQVLHTYTVLSELLELAGRVDVWTLLYHAIKRTGYLAALAMAERTEKTEGRLVGNVQKFLAMARDRGGASIADFLLRLQDLKLAEVREGQVEGYSRESGAVQLMSIHAAKGLEFPVVAVADIGRSNNHGGAQSRILHDPAYGLVCQVRDGKGDWEKSVGLLWSNWMEAQMEDAESHRLLYVACTRAADLLLLSGQVGRKGSWLYEVAQAWDIDTDADNEDEESFIMIENHPVRLLRPTYTPSAQSDVNAPLEASPGLDKIPVLADPLPVVDSRAEIAVTRLARTLAHNPDDLPTNLPAVRVTSGDLLSTAKSTPDPSKQRVPGYLLGNLVHQILADWDCLVWPHDQLMDHIQRTARMVGILDDAGNNAVSDRAIWMLRALVGSALYHEISRAQNRIVEAPFTLDTPVGNLHGVIDLLYQEDGGQWHLVDWKTEWVRFTAIEQAAREHLPQLAVYAQAAEKFLGSKATVTLCFLSLGAAVYRIRDEELSNTWASLQR